MSRQIKRRSRQKSAKPRRKHWEALIRSIDRENIPYLLRDNAMTPPKRERPYWYPAVYAHYVDSSLDKYSLVHWTYNADFVLVIDPSILKTHSFTICKSMYGGRCLDKKRSEKEREQWTLMKSKGSRRRKPSMKVMSDYFKKEANDQYNDMKLDPYIVPKRGFDFANSHEVLFDEIPMSYVRGVIVHFVKDKQMIEKAFPHLPVVLIKIPKDYKARESEFIQKTILPTIQKLVS